MLRNLLPSLVVLSLLAAVPAHAQRHERKMALIEESGKAQSAKGGIKFQVDKPYDVVYEKALNYLKKAEYSIESASKDTGQIITEMAIKGGWSQTGTRIYVIFIKDTETSTTLRVVVSEQNRKKALQTEPWDPPKVNLEESMNIADDLKREYGLLAPGSKKDSSVDGSTASLERIVPFRTGEVIPLGIVERLVTIQSVEVVSWPKPDVIQKAEGKPGELASLTLKFTYANQGKSKWKCKYSFAILDDKGAEIGSGEKEASLGGEEKSDTNRVSMKMKTLDFPKAVNLRVRVVLTRAD